jgi:hypothetical protein
MVIVVVIIEITTITTQKKHSNDATTSNSNNGTTMTSNSSCCSSFYVEFFHPIHPIQIRPDNDQNNTASHIISIHVNHTNRSNSSSRHNTSQQGRHDSIIVSGVACGMTLLNENGIVEGMSVFVVDEIYIGCILQSKCFIDVQDLINFITTIPHNRIIIINGKIIHHHHHHSIDHDCERKIPIDEKTDDDDNLRKENVLWDPDSVMAQQLLSLLPNFRLDLAKSDDGMIYIGQIGTTPDWAICCSTHDMPINGITLEAMRNHDEIIRYQQTLQLKTVPNTCPSSISGRLHDDTIMSFETQVISNQEQKRHAFLSFIKKKQNEANGIYAVSGYSMKPGSPIYL